MHCDKCFVDFSKNKSSNTGTKTNWRIHVVTLLNNV